MDLNTMIMIANGAFVVLMIGCLMVGYKNGLVLSLVNCIGSVVALAAGFLLSSSASKILMLYPLSLTPMNDTPFGPVFQQMFNQIVWFVLIVAVVKLFCMILKPLAKGLKKIPVLGFFNQLLGAAFGLINMWIYSTIICMVLGLPSISWGSAVVEGSLFKNTSLFTDMMKESIEIKDEDVNKIMDLVHQIQNLDEETILQIQDVLSQYGVTQAQIDALFENLE